MGWVLLCALCACGERSAGSIRVGSKAFTESVILGEIAAQLLRAQGARVTHRRELGGTRVLWDALGRGELDLYPQYTGTLRAELLPELSSAEPSGRADAQLREALGKRHLRMSPP